MSRQESTAEIVERMLGESGSAITKLVRESSEAADTKLAQATDAISKAVDAKVKEVVADIRSTKESLTKQQNALKAVATRVDDKVDQTELATIKALIAQAGKTLALAMEDVNQASTTTDLDQAQEAANKAADRTKEASDGLDKTAEKIAALTQRVEELERWRKETVDPALTFIDDHRQEIAALKGAKTTTPPRGDQPAPVPATPTRTKVIKGANPRNWGGLAWALALIFGLAALVLALTTLCPWVSHVLNQQWAWLRATLSFLAGLVLTSIGFFGGGLLGDTLTEKIEEDDK